MMSSLVPGGLFSTPGLNCHSTPTHPETTPEELDQLYARQDFNGRPWPCDGHVARMYDVRNTSTNMIILNNKYGEGFSRLRGYYCPSGERNVDIERHFEDRPRNLFYHLRCFDSSLSSFPPKKVETDLERAYRSDNPPDTLEDAIKGLLPAGSTYRTLYPPHLRNQFQKHVENLKKRSQKLPKIGDNKGERKSSTYLRQTSSNKLGQTSSTYVRRTSSVKTPLLVVNHRRLSEYSPSSFYGFFESTEDVTEVSEKAEPAISKISVTPATSSSKSDESAFSKTSLTSPSKSGESAFSNTSLTSSNKSEEIKLPDIEYSHHKGEGIIRPKSRLGRPEEPVKSRNIKTSRSTEVTLMVLKELQSKSTENVKQEEHLESAEDERKSIQSDGPVSAGSKSSCQSEDEKETQDDDLKQDEEITDQTDNIDRESGCSPKLKEHETEANINHTTHTTHKSNDQRLSEISTEIPSINHTKDTEDTGADRNEPHMDEHQTAEGTSKSNNSMVPDSNIMKPDGNETKTSDTNKPDQSKLESTDNYLNSNHADKMADTSSAMSFLEGSSDGETEEKPGISGFQAKSPDYASQSEDTARGSRSARDENKEAGSKDKEGAKDKKCSVL